MQLSDKFWEMAERFIDYIHTETGFNAIVCDDRGIIQKAYVKQRIGQSHAGAERILSTSIHEISISAEDERRNPLTKEGLNCAIVMDRAKVATFGIGGRLEIVTPVARIASRVMSGWVTQLRQQDLLRATADEVSKDISALTGNVERVIGKFETVSQAMLFKVSEASKSVTATDKVMNSVAVIGQQTKFLSFNARIEAGRLGENGRAFSSIAEEMSQLSRDAQECTQTVQNTIHDIRKAVADVHVACQQSSGLFAENVDTLRAIAPMVGRLRASIETLESSFKEDMT